MSSQSTQTSLPTEFSWKAYKDLQEENKLLHGKIRGYLTLGTILKEQKEECKKLMNEKKTLEEKLNQFQNIADSLSDRNTDEKENKMNKIGEKNGENKPVETDVTHELNNVDKFSNVLGKVDTNALAQVIRLQGAKTYTTPPDAYGSNHVLTNHSTGQSKISSNGVAYPPDSEYDDKFPMQESIGLEHSNGSDLNTSGSSSIVKIDPTSGIFSSDSIFGDQQRHNAVMQKLTKQVSTKAVYGSGTSSSGSLNLMEFPSVQASGAVSDTKISSPVEEVAPELNHQPPVSSEHNADKEQKNDAETVLSIRDKVSQVAEALDLTTDGPADRIRKFLEEQLIPDLSKQEEDLSKYKKCNEVLLRDIQKLIDENKRLLQRIQQLEHQMNNLTPAQSLSSQTQVVGWEYIKNGDIPKSENEGLLKSERPEDLQMKMAALQEQNSRLLDANTRWQAHWSQTKKDRETVEKYKAEIEQLNRQISTFRTEDEKRQQDFDKILLTAKNRQSEAEAEREEVQSQLERITLRAEAMEAEIVDTKEKLSQCRREKQSLEAELTVLRNGSQRSLNLSPNKTEAELHTEIAVLREQLSVFQEDFDKERTDRAQAQSSKDEIRKQLENEQRKTATLQEKLRGFERQLRSAEENVKQTMAQNQSQQLEITNLKTKLRQERENNARLQHPYGMPQAGGYYPMGQGRQPQEQDMKLTAHPQTDPYAQPVPPYLFQTNRMQTASQRPYQYTVSNRSQVAPEQLPGAWNCVMCTYVNHPSRSVCEICGHIHVSGEVNGSYTGNQSQPLMPRGDLPQVNGGEEIPDLSTDSGNFAMN